MIDTKFYIKLLVMQEYPDLITSLYEHKINQEEYDLIISTLISIEEELSNGTEINSAEYERRIRSISQNSKMDSYHFCEEFLLILEERGGLFSELNKLIYEK